MSAGFHFLLWGLTINKIIATLTKQLAVQLSNPFIDLYWSGMTVGLYFWYRESLTSGTTQEHQKHHLGPPRGTRKTIWDHLGAPPGSPLGPPRGTRKSTWDNPGEPSKPDTENTLKNHFFGTCFGTQIEWYFLFFFALVFTRVPSEGYEVQMSKICRKGCRN